MSNSSETQTQEQAMTLYSAYLVSFRFGLRWLGTVRGRSQADAEATLRRNPHYAGAILKLVALH